MHGTAETGATQHVGVCSGHPSGFVRFWLLLDGWHEESEVRGNRSTVDAAMPHVWCYGRVLIDWEGADGVADEDLDLVRCVRLCCMAMTHRFQATHPAVPRQTWSAKSVKLDIKQGSKIRRFSVPKLHDEITDAKILKKATRFVISMRKKDELAWYVMAARLQDGTG